MDLQILVRLESLPALEDVHQDADTLEFLQKDLSAFVQAHHSAKVSPTDADKHNKVFEHIIGFIPNWLQSKGPLVDEVLRFSHFLNVHASICSPV